jgi:medium-chain acyl-[acyl-carrier-protein] hydrolase
LPGRGTRFGEAPFTRLDPLLDALEQPLTPLLDVPFALFGHSMGALVAFELARRLRRRGGPRPVHLFVAAYEAPQIVSSEPAAHVLPDPLFLAELRRYGGLPESVLLEPELLELFLPIVRADFEVLETWSHTPEEPLDIPISAFGGLADPMTPPDQIEAWRVQTRSDFTRRMFPGDHFFLDGDRAALLCLVSQALT